MATTLEELRVRIGAEITDLEEKLDKATKLAKKFGKDMQKMGEDLTKYVTLPMLALGGASLKMAADEQKAFAQVAASLRNVGRDFAALEPQIKDTLTSMQNMTGFADDEFAGALSNLINITGNFDKSMSALSVTADLARAKNMDLWAASELVGKAMNGNTAMLKRYGIELREGATATEVLNVLTAKFGGASSEHLKTFAGKWDLLKARMSDAAEAWGMVLIPIAEKFLILGIAISDKVKEWADRFSKLDKGTQNLAIGIAIAVAAVGPMLIVFGKLITFLPLLKTGFTALTAVITPLTLKVALLAFVALQIIINWEKVAATFRGVVAFAFIGILTLWEKVFSVLQKLSAGSILLFPLAEAFKKLGQIVSDVKNQVEIDAIDMGSKIQENGGFMGTTVDFMKTKFGELAASAMAAFGQVTIAGNAASVARATQLTFFQSWAERMKNTAKDMAASVSQSIAGMAADMVTSLAQGTFDGAKLLMGFLTATLNATVQWAVGQMLAAEGVAKALTAVFANPILAAFLIAGLIAGVAMLAGSFKSQVAMAEGGVVTGPTNALVGEAGPEAVIPLSSPKARNMMGGGGGSQTIIIELDGRNIAQTTVEHLPGVLRLQGIGV